MIQKSVDMSTVSKLIRKTVTVPVRTINISKNNWTIVQLFGYEKQTSQRDER